MQSSSPMLSNCEELKKSCIDCHITATPCWRGGPAGPRTLCNACGIRYRKTRKALVGLDKAGGQRDRKKRKTGKGNRSSELGVPMKLVGLLGLERQNWKRKLGEEEQAAILLMSLSRGSVSA